MSVELESRAASLHRIERELATWDRRAFSPDNLERAAAVWARRARDEHASIAAFDRFSLGLLAVAAPPELIEKAHEAALDEILHARICFAIASSYGRGGMGPGPLAVDRALDDVSTLPLLVQSTIFEGCMGETIAAAEARAAAERTKERAAREALFRIAVDEERHAELAWSFVGWGLSAAPELAPRMKTFFRAMSSRALVPPQFAGEEGLEELGALSYSQREAVRQQVIDDVIIPAARSLFGSLEW